ncbi:MAG: alpha-mannosidase [Chloroflexi bacterium]|nr:alpha-mannosidase [Chloroflexota bacterium]
MQSQIHSKFKAVLEKFKPYIYLAELPVNGLEWSAEPPVGCHPEKITLYGGWQPIAPGQTWGKSDVTCWFKGLVKIPVDWAGRRVALKLRLGPYQNVTEPEMLVYLNGQEAQGLGKFHDRIVLTQKAQGGETYQLAVEAYSGVKNTRPVLVDYSLVAIDNAAENFYFNLQAGAMAAAVIPESSLLFAELGTLLNQAYRLLDLSQPGSASFNASLEEANALLEQGYQRLRASAPAHRPRHIVTGHSHIDMAWLWPLWQTRRKASRTFSTVLKYMDEYPHYHYTQSQPQLYKYVKEDQPDLYRRIRERIAEGRWEPLGAMWIESDCNLTSGESLVRQFLYGQRFLEREFGRRSRVLWLPDAFGFSPALPQLMQGSGVDYFMTTKLSWSQVNRPPADTFWWEGLDGTRVLAHFVTTPSQDDRWHTYNGNFNAPEIAGLWEEYRQKEHNSELLYLYGWGDGGGGPTYEMLERSVRWQDFPGLPTCEQGSAEAFFERLGDRVAEAEDLPGFYGELYLEYHQGTYTSQGWLKQANRQNEFLLREAEIYSSWAALPGNPASEPRLAEAWERLLLNQFHDILPGSSIGAVYEDSRRDQDFIRQTALEITGQALQQLVRNIPGQGWVIFNPLSWERVGPILLEGLDNLPTNLKESAGGQPLLTQATPGGLLVSGLHLPPLGYITVKTGQEQATIPELKISLEPPFLENQYLRVEFDRQGEISSIFDKEAGREVVAPGTTLNRLTAYEDRPRRFSAWNIEPYYREKATPLLAVSSIQVVEDGPVRATFEIQRAYLNSTITQRISLWAGSRKLDFATEIDWQEKQILLKAIFPLNVHTAYATCDVAFGNFTRPTQPNTTWEQARYEVTAHKWVDLSEGDYGVSLLNDSKYGHNLDRNTIGLTLLKSPDAPDPQADLGHHSFTYSLYPHPGDWRQARTVHMAYDLNVGARTLPLPGQTEAIAQPFTLLKNVRSGIIISTLKSAEDGDGVIVRLYECHNERGPERLTFAFPIKAAWECNLLEDKQCPVAYDGNIISFEISPYEIKTFLVQF